MQSFGRHQLALHRFSKGQSPHPPVLLIHGSIENGKVFFSKSGKGYAPFLADAGFDVFVADLRGKGESTPFVARGFKASQTDTISKEIPFLVDRVLSITGADSLHLGAHSWGGVLLLSAYALCHQKWNIRSFIFFGTKRRIGIFNWARFTTIDLGWSILGAFFTILYGYLPAKKLKMGSDNEPSRFYFQVNRWVYSKRWTDAETGTDYRKILKNLMLPPVHLYTGKNDKLLGHPEDVRRLALEIGHPEAVTVLSRENGYRHDYDHINILTHPDAVHDHFQEVLTQLQKYSR
jgi:pimeloyl-ACP methyl ester carboxylesterase